MKTCIIIFLLGTLGFVTNRKNIIMIIICIEIILLAITVIFILSSNIFDDVVGLSFSLYIIAIAGAESAIGLGIIVAYYRIKGNINITN